MVLTLRVFQTTLSPTIMALMILQHLLCRVLTALMECVSVCSILTPVMCHRPSMCQCLPQISLEMDLETLHKPSVSPSLM